jgi:hypothetical protein
MSFRFMHIQLCNLIPIKALCTMLLNQMRHLIDAVKFPVSFCYQVLFYALPLRNIEAASKSNALCAIKGKAFSINKT